jgi:RNA polymerase sigma-70 factor (ECF subfamily)
VTNLSDHELMRRLAAGDFDAFEVLLRRWDDRVGRVLSRLVAVREDVEDLRQEVFMRVLTHSTRYRPRGAFSTWIYRIVINLARDAARRRRRVLPLGNHEPADGNGAPLEASSSRELAACVESALGSLPETSRELLVLKHYADLSFSEIAGVLNEPVSTVKSRTHAALRRLHAELQQRGVTEMELEP